MSRKNNNHGRSSEYLVKSEISRKVEEIINLIGEGEVSMTDWLEGRRVTRYLDQHMKISREKSFDSKGLPNDDFKIKIYRSPKEYIAGGHIVYHKNNCAGNEKLVMLKDEEMWVERLNSVYSIATKHAVSKGLEKLAVMER